MQQQNEIPSNKANTDSYRLLK